jgi:hypothetical protein
LRDVLQAERRTLAAFSSDIAEFMVLRSASAIWDILLYVRQELVEERRGRYLRRLAAWRALTRPIAAIMETLFRPVVRSRRRSWTSLWVAILGLTIGKMELETGASYLTSVEDSRVQAKSGVAPAPQPPQQPHIYFHMTIRIEITNGR